MKDYCDEGKHDSDQVGIFEPVKSWVAEKLKQISNSFLRKFFSSTFISSAFSCKKAAAFCTMVNIIQGEK